MTFFERQEQAHQKTRYLLMLFIGAIATLSTVFYGVVIALTWIVEIGKQSLVVIGRARTDASGPKTTWQVLQWASAETSKTWHWWQPHLFGIVTLIILIFIGSGSLYKWRELKQGGKKLALSLGGNLVKSYVQNTNQRQLLNVVEEVAISANIPVPALYILPRESGINAFAAGLTTDDAVLGVTQGCLNHLSREQLQGIIGHEVSHILNGDMRLNLKLIAGLHGIFLIHITGQRITRIRPSQKREAPGFVMAGLLLSFLGWGGYVFGRLIQSAVSRQREFLADASAVQFTRSPEGLMTALQTIAKQGSTIRSPAAASASHLFFGNALSDLGWLATHPPLQERIQRLRMELKG